MRQAWLALCGLLVAAVPAAAQEDAEAERLKIDVDPTSGAEMTALIEQVSRTPEATVARVRAALAAR